jgi:hypothetical protein
MRRRLMMLAEVKAVANSKAPSGEFEVILSMPTLDRDGEIIDAKAFEPLPESIPFHAFHDFTDPVGRAVPYYDGQVLKARGYYASTARAQEIRTLVAEGVIGHTSVGFMPPVREVMDGVPHIVKGELLEGSFASVPSNREAAVLVGKAYEIKASKAERLQQIHDLSVANGATRETKAYHLAGRKSIAGSFEDRRDQLRDVLRSVYDDGWWVDILATFEDEVVFQVEDATGSTRYQATYSITDGAVTLGTAEEVEITEVVAPKTVTNADPEVKAAAPAAATPPADAHVAPARAVLSARADLLLLTA